MKIICTTRLLPSAPFIGTRIGIEVTDDSPVFGISHLECATDHELITIDWGDDESEVHGNVYNLRHTYRKPGRYEVRLSDDVGVLTLYNQSEEGPYSDVFPRRVREVTINGPALTELGTFCFCNCANLTDVSLSGSGVTTLPSGCFRNCTSLAGRIDFPTVGRISRTAPFVGCTGGIAEIHFPVASESAITSHAAYRADPTLGTGTAACVFDL